MDKLLVKVEVESDFVDVRGGVTAKGKQWEMREQKAWFYLGSKFPKEITISLEGGIAPYKPGLYVVDLLPALKQGDFGRLEIDGRRLVLDPYVEPAAKLAAAK